MLLKKLYKKSKQGITNAISSLYDEPLAPPTMEEQELINELRNTFHEIPQLTSRSGSIGPASEQEWSRNSLRLKELVLTDDPREFLRWDVILRTMFVAHSGYVSHELSDLKKRNDWEDRWRKAIKESSPGHPIPYWRYPQSSENLIHNAYHLAQFEEKTGTYINEMYLVLEFGGGYGSMCRAVRQLGFEGKYVIYDLPAFSALQRYFLKSIGLVVQHYEEFLASPSGVLCISDLTKLKDVVCSQPKEKNAMFIATWSLSEAPMALRAQVLPLLDGFRAFLFAYQDRFNEIDNVAAFQSWTARQQRVQWHDWRMAHLHNNNRYLVGKRMQEE